MHEASHFSTKGDYVAHSFTSSAAAEETMLSIEQRRAAGGPAGCLLINVGTARRTRRGPSKIIIAFRCRFGFPSPN